MFDDNIRLSSKAQMAFDKLSPEDEKLVSGVINRLAYGERLESEYRDHKLNGRFRNYRECCIRDDLLLVYRYERGVLHCENIGSHKELFNDFIRSPRIKESMAVANYIVENIDVDILKLNKLMYFVYGAYLAVNRHVLFPDRPEARIYGPIFPRVYDAFFEFDDIITDVQPLRGTVYYLEECESMQDIFDLIDAVLNYYGKLPEDELDAYTFTMPWERTYEDDRINIIPDELIYKHFIEIVKVDE